MNLERLTANILDRSLSEDFKGYDPFDGLNGCLTQKIPWLKTGMTGLGLLQFHKRSPINFRPLFNIPKMRNPKGIGIFILGLLEDYDRTKNRRYLDIALTLGDWLLSKRSNAQAWGHSCWGYHFDWNARAFYVPKGKPNVISTVYISMALEKLADYSGIPKYLKVAYDSADFIEENLFVNHPVNPYIAYIPGEKALVHNANLWGAAWIAHVGLKKNQVEKLNIAQQVTATTLAAQKSNGSWVYGERDHHQFIDGFHTGYNLEALQMMHHATPTLNYSQAIQRGFDFYKQNLITGDGIAMYYAENKYPLDMHSVAQAIITLVTIGNKSDTGLALKIAKKSIELLYDEKTNQFAYQKSRLWVNRVDYTRWTQAWVYYAFSLLINELSKSTDHEIS